MSNLQGFGLVFIIVLAIALIGFGPVFTILSLNLLFNLSIPITFWTWLSTIWLQSIVVGASAVKFNSK